MNRYQSAISFIDPELWREAKKRAIDKGITIGQFIEKLIEKELHSKGKKMKKERNKIYLMDCIQGMRELLDEIEVDAIVTSPPYNMGIVNFAIIRADFMLNRYSYMLSSINLKLDGGLGGNK